MTEETKSNEFHPGGSDKSDDREEHRDMDADKLSVELTHPRDVDEGDIEQADKDRVKTGARYGGRDSGMGVEGTNKPPKDSSK